MKHLNVNTTSRRQLFFIASMIFGLWSCNNKTANSSSYNEVFIEQEEETMTSSSSLAGDWRLDSVVFITDGLRGQQQIPFSTTLWSFTDKGKYTVKIMKSDLKISVDEDGDMGKNSLKAELPASEMAGRYRYLGDELTTTILGGDIKYSVVKQDDNQLQLRSQRMQVAPISKEDEGKLAEHFFTKIQTIEYEDQ